ncbi:MAG: hypothetical protein ACJA0G_001665 [Kangiellaceae bacterium]|jgi:hypothetical protein
MTRIPPWFHVLASVALFWNLLGAVVVIMSFMITPEAIATLPQEQQPLHTNIPVWSLYGSLLAVAAGSLGCLALLTKKAWAYPLFISSLVGLVLQNIGIFILVNGAAIVGTSGLFMQAFVVIIAIGLLLLSKKAIKRGWIS